MPGRRDSVSDPNSRRSEAGASHRSGPASTDETARPRSNCRGAPQGRSRAAGLGVCELDCISSVTRARGGAAERHGRVPAGRVESQQHSNVVPSYSSGSDARYGSRPVPVPLALYANRNVEASGGCVELRASQWQVAAEMRCGGAR